MALGLSREALDTPYNRLLFWLIFGATKGMLDLCLGSVLWDGYLNNNVGSEKLVRKIGDHLQIDGNSGDEEETHVRHIVM